MNGQTTWAKVRGKRSDLSTLLQAFLPVLVPDRIDYYDVHTKINLFIVCLGELLLDIIEK